MIARPGGISSRCIRSASFVSVSPGSDAKRPIRESSVTDAGTCLGTPVRYPPMAVLHGWRLCPRDGAELDLSDLPRRVSCPVCGFVAYANPKPAAVGLITDEQGRLLLVKRAIEPFKGCWDAPGGFVEEGEHPLDAVRRELLEET